MSAWDGSNEESPRYPGIPEDDAKRIWAESEEWNDDIRPHYFKAMSRGYLLAKKTMQADLLSFIRWYDKLPARVLYNNQLKEIVALYITTLNSQHNG